MNNELDWDPRLHENRRTTSVVPAPNNWPYLIAIVIMLGTASIVSAAIVILRPTGENAGLIATIFGFVSTTTMSLLAYMKAQETHLSVNSRLDAFMAAARAASRAEGVATERQEARGRTEAAVQKALTDTHDNVLQVEVVNTPLATKVISDQ